MSSFIDNFRIREQMRAQDNYQGEGKLRIMPIHEERGGQGMGNGWEGGDVG